MILAPYRIAPSRIPGAGRGLILTTAQPAGCLLIAPDGISPVYTRAELLALPDQARVQAAAVRWFGEYYSVALDWPDECYVNHDFDPTGLWHLGFVFAARDLQAETELTVDYRHLLGEGQEEAFRDARSGRPIIGFSAAESLRRSTAALLGLVSAS